MVITLDQLKTSLQIIKEYVDELGAYMKNAISDIPTNNNQLENGAGYQTEAEVKTIVANEASTLITDKIAASLITNTASGAIASFPDGADNVPVKDLTVQIEPVQDLHGQANPYPAGGGKNLFPPFNNYSGNGLTTTANNDGSITITGTAEGTGGYITAYVNFAKTIPANTTIAISTKNNVPSQLRIIFNDGTADIHQNNNSTVTSIQYDITRAALYLFTTSGVQYNFTIYPQLEIGSAATAYAPYSNICPISGWTGANVVRTGFNQWDEEWELGIYNTTTGEKESSSNQIRCKNGIPVIPDATYYLKVPYPSTLTNFCRGLLYDADDNFVGTIPNFNSNGILYTVPNNVHYIRFFVSLIYGTTYKNDICINFSDPAKNGTYEPYQSNTYSITFPTEAGTVYGGTLDVTTGVLTVDRAMVDLGDLDWTISYGRFNAQLSNIKPSSRQGAKPNIICSSYPTITPNEWYAGNIGITSLINGYVGEGYVGLIDPSYSDAATLKTALSGVQLVYELTNPITYQLTPQEVETLLGQNNIWADCGDVSVDYNANTKLYIEKLTAPTEDDMVANTNIPSGTYFMVGNTLYLSTTTIPAGDTINPGTNCTLMNLASALNALNA